MKICREVESIHDFCDACKIVRCRAILPVKNQCISVPNTIYDGTGDRDKSKAISRASGTGASRRMSDNAIYKTLNENGIVAFIQNLLAVVWRENPEINHDTSELVLEYAEQRRAAVSERMSLHTVKATLKRAIKQRSSNVEWRDFFILTRANVIELRTLGHKIINLIQENRLKRQQHLTPHGYEESMSRKHWALSNDFLLAHAKDDDRTQAEKIHDAAVASKMGSWDTATGTWQHASNPVSSHQLPLPYHDNTPRVHTPDDLRQEEPVSTSPYHTDTYPQHPCMYVVPYPV